MRTFLIGLLLLNLLPPLQQTPRWQAMRTEFHAAAARNGTFFDR